MKNFAIFVLLAVFCKAQARANNEMIKEMMIKCKEQSGASEDIDEMLATKALPDSKEGKCMLACTMTAFGKMKNGKIDVDYLRELAKEKISNNPEYLEKINGIIEKCAIFDDTEMDECEIAYTYMTCKKGMLTA